MYLREGLNKISGIATMEYTDIQERVINYGLYLKVLIDAKELGLTGVLHLNGCYEEHHIEGGVSTSSSCASAHYHR